jgi:hypothetical protein
MMSEGKTPPPKSGADRLDAALAAWPAAPRTALEWDDSAERVLSAIGSGQPTRLAKALGDVSDEDLLRPPLPTLPGEVQSSAAIETRSEGAGMSTTASRERDRAGFKDLAKLAGMTPAPAPVSSGAPASGSQEKADWEPNSGVIDLAAIAAGDGASKPAAVATAVPATVPEVMSTLRSSGNAAPAPAMGPAKGEKKASPWLAIGSVVAVAAVAAGVFFGMQRTQRADAPAAVALATPPTPAAMPAAAQPATAAAVTPTPTEEHGVDPSSLPPASTGAVAAHAVGPGPAVTKPAATTAAAPTTDPALVAVVPTATATPSASASLQSLMQQAAGVTSSPTAAAATTADPDAPLPAPGSVPLKPSQGAIQGALGAALPAARACLGPDDPISHATITFGSDGTVQNVGVSGGAAGKPAEACIRNALKRARVAPFAQPTFTATATVRPN